MITTCRDNAPCACPLFIVNKSYNTLMKKTQTYYNQNHQVLIERYDAVTLTPLHNLLKKHIKSNNKILEIGFGSGRDMRYMHQKLKAEWWGVDSTQGFVDALAKDNAFDGRLFCARLPILGLDFGFKFDLIVAIAVIMHLSLEELERWVSDIPNYLSKDGKVILSYSPKPRESDERFFEDLRGGVVEQIFMRGGFRLVEECESFDGLGREVGWRSEVYGYKS